MANNFLGSHCLLGDDRPDRTGRGRGGGEVYGLSQVGGSRPIMDVLKEMGVDLDSPEPFARALSVIDRLVEEMDALAAKAASITDQG